MLEMSTPAQWGASPAEWDHFDLVLGLTEDLLPIVSNKNANSTIEGLGKVPSVYKGHNGHRRAVGFGAFTAHRSDHRHIKMWRSEPDYGIGIQTRYVRAIDIDMTTPEYAKKARMIIDAYFECFGIKLPVRFRSSSSKILMPFVCQDVDFGKRRLKLKGEGDNKSKEAIELLVSGQQFVAVGTHPSGDRYEWEGGLPELIPAVTVDQINELWELLRASFNFDAAENSMSIVPKVPRKKVADDDVAEFIRSSTWFRGEDAKGSIQIHCPWKDEHSSDTGVGETVYHPPGQGGFVNGHFHCLHSSCAGRTDDEFLSEIGYSQIKAIEHFDNVGVVTREDDEFSKIALLFSKANPKTNLLSSGLNNVADALMIRSLSGVSVVYDNFTDRICADFGIGYYPLSDVELTQIRYVLHSFKYEGKRFAEISEQTMRNAVDLVASKCSYDSAQAYFAGLEWDGVKRVDRLFVDYFVCDDREYSRELGKYTATAMASRLLVPGSKVDVMPVLYGMQGIKKSWGIASLCPDPSFFTELNFHTKAEEQVRAMRGKLIGEVAELSGLKTREHEDIKAFLTRTSDPNRKLYREYYSEIKRRIVLFGTTNQIEFLGDPSGSRRYGPIVCFSVDVDAIKRDVMQIWAEGIAMFKEQGVVYKRLGELLPAEHEKFRVIDDWEDFIVHFLHEEDAITGHIPNEVGRVEQRELYRVALGIERGRVDSRSRTRIVNIMRKLGWEPKVTRIDGEVLRGFVKVNGRED